MTRILAIESSCDETSVAITDNGKLLANVVATQIAVHEKYGGVMPEIASRLHTENITVCLTEALRQAKLKPEEIDAFAVTRGPGLIGCLHVGLQAAKTLAMLYDKPLIPVHHLAGHIYANEYVGTLKFPLLCVVVSGGNTELVIMDLQSEHERYLTEEIVKGPMFLIDYPKEIKAFYMRENDDGKTVAACDCLVPGEGEIIGGSQREERYDVLKAKMDKIGNTKGLEWYLNLRKYGGCIHSGFGIGFDRLLMYITGVANIRDTEPYPRTSSNLKY